MLRARDVILVLLLVSCCLRWIGAVSSEQQGRAFHERDTLTTDVWIQCASRESAPST